MKKLLGLFSMIATIAFADNASNYFSAAWQIEGIEGEILLNGCPISTNSGGGSTSVSQWVVNGKNRVELRIQKVLAQEAFASFILQEGNLAAPNQLKEKKELTIDWKSAGNQKLPVIIAKETDLASALGKHPWESAKHLEKNQATLKEAFAVVETVYAAFKKGDITALMKIVGENADWLGRLYGKSDGYQQTQKNWARIIGKGLDLGTPKFDDFEFHFYCDNRMIEILQKKGGKAIQIKSGSGTIGMPLSLGKIDGSWKAVGP